MAPLFQLPPVESFRTVRVHAEVGVLSVSCGGVGRCGPGPRGLGEFAVAAFGRLNATFFPICGARGIGSWSSSGRLSVGAHFLFGGGRASVLPFWSSYWQDSRFALL